MRKITNLLLDAKNRRFYLADKIEDFFGLPRRKLLYRRDGLSHRRAPSEPQMGWSSIFCFGGKGHVEQKNWPSE